MRRSFGGWIHGLIGWPIFAALTALTGLGIVLGALGDRSGLAAARALGLGWGRLLWWLQPFWRRRGRGSLPGPGPWVIVANHQSVIDIPCLFGLPVPLRVAARPSIFRVPLLGRFARWSGQVDASRLLEEGQRALDQGFSVVVFPEGSRSPDGRVQRFRRGAFELARRAGVAVVPVAIDGSQLILGKRHRMPQRLVVEVHAHVLAPISPELEPREMAREARRVVSEALARIRAHA